jgi:hypothetical protein
MYPVSSKINVTDLNFIFKTLLIKLKTAAWKTEKRKLSPCQSELTSIISCFPLFSKMTHNSQALKSYVLSAVKNIFSFVYRLPAELLAYDICDQDLNFIWNFVYQTEKLLNEKLKIVARVDSQVSVVSCSLLRKWQPGFEVLRTQRLNIFSLGKVMCMLNY